MGIFKHIQEIKLRVEAKRMFKAMVTQVDTIPLPAAVTSIDKLEGDATCGKIMVTKLADGTCVKHKTEIIDADKYVSKHTLIEGPLIGGKIESIQYIQKFEHSSDGGCVAKVESEYHTKGDLQLNDEDKKAVSDQLLGFYKLTEEHLLARPDICA